MLLRLLRQFAAVISKELGNGYFEEVASQPGRLFFPKHVHQLESAEPETPDGVSLDYIRLAVAKNEAVWKETTVDTAVVILASHISYEIGWAALLERHIAERLN